MNESNTNPPGEDRGWRGAEQLRPRSFACENCGERVSSSCGYWTDKQQGRWLIHICSHCQSPVYFDTSENIQLPLAMPGHTLDRLPTDDVGALYDEARRAIQVGAFTAAVLCCRKILMHVAVVVDQSHASGPAATVTCSEHTGS